MYSQAAYMFYTVATSVPIAELMIDALICARDTGHDVFNALDIFENAGFLKVCCLNRVKHRTRSCCRT